MITIYKNSAPCFFATILDNEYTFVYWGNTFSELVFKIKKGLTSYITPYAIFTTYGAMPYEFYDPLIKILLPNIGVKT